MGQQRAHTLRRDNLPKSGHIFGVKDLCFATPGVPGKKLKGIGFNCDRFLTGFGKSTSNGQVGVRLLTSFVSFYFYYYLISFYESNFLILFFIILDILHFLYLT